MEATQLDQLSQVIQSLGFDPVQVGQWATMLVAWRMVIKLVSGKIQSGLESAIDKASETGDSSIIGWITRLIESLPYRICAWIIDTLLSVKLPLKIKRKEMPGD